MPLHDCVRLHGVRRYPPSDWDTPILAALTVKRKQEKKAAIRRAMCRPTIGLPPSTAPPLTAKERRFRFTRLAFSGGKVEQYSAAQSGYERGGGPFDALKSN